MDITLTNVVSIESPETVVDGVKDMFPRKTHLVDRRAIVDGGDPSPLPFLDGEIHLAEDHHFAARDVVFLESFPHDNL